MLTNIANFNNNADWFYLIVAVIVVDLVVILLARYPGRQPYFKVGALNDWYDRFGAVAVLGDLLSLLIGLAGARYIYTLAGFSTPLMFVAAILIFQAIHDIFFYVAVIRPLPKGANGMIDVFKTYADENGAKILVADALMLLASAATASGLKALPAHYTVSTGLLATYAMTYTLYTKRT
jgi:hypothetical protein